MSFEVNADNLPYAYGCVQEVYEFAKHYEPADDHEKLAQALALQESTITGAIARTSDETSDYAGARARRVQRELNSHRADMAEGAELARLSMDTILGVPEAVDKILQGPPCNLPDIVGWMRRQIDSSGLAKGKIALHMGIEGVALSHLLGNRVIVRQEHATGLAEALGILAGKTEDELARDHRTALSKFEGYQTYLDAKQERSRGSHELPPPLSDMKALKPIAGVIGATILEGLDTASVIASRRNPMEWETAMEALKAHRRGLITQFRLLQASVSVIHREPGAVDTFDDPTRDYPLSIIWFNHRAETLELTDTEIAERSGLSLSLVSRIMTNQVHPTPKASQALRLVLKQTPAN